MIRDDLLATLLGTGPLVRPEAPYRLVELAGPDAGDFLQRLCTQDVLGLEAEGLLPAAFLDAKGKVLGTCLVCRRGGSFWLEVQREQEERLLALLERYHFTEKLSIAGRPSACAERILGATGAPLRRARWLDDGGLELCFDRLGVRFERRYTLAVPGEAAAAATDAAADDRAECLRMLAGVVRVGVDTEPNTLALEALLDDHCSTTKGCYTGQEIVARIHTYGHVNRRLCLLRLAAGERLLGPQPLHEPVDRLPVGRVLHAVPIPGQAARLGTGYLPRDFQAPGTALALADGTAVEVIGYEPLPA